MLEKLATLAQFPFQPETAITAPDGLSLDIKTLGNWTFSYWVDFPAKTVIVARFTKMRGKDRRA